MKCRDYNTEMQKYYTEQTENQNMFKSMQPIFSLCLEIYFGKLVIFKRID